MRSGPAPGQPPTVPPPCPPSPIVGLLFVSNVLRQKRDRQLVLPTPLSPISTTCAQVPQAVASARRLQRSATAAAAAALCTQSSQPHLHQQVVVIVGPAAARHLGCLTTGSCRRHHSRQSTGGGDGGSRDGDGESSGLLASLPLLCCTPGHEPYRFEDAAVPVRRPIHRAGLLARAAGLVAWWAAEGLGDVVQGAGVAQEVLEAPAVSPALLAARPNSPASLCP